MLKRAADGFQSLIMLVQRLPNVGPMQNLVEDGWNYVGHALLVWQRTLDQHGTNWADEQNNVGPMWYVNIGPTMLPI